MPWLDIEYARSVVKQMYPSDGWRRRVNKMPDTQILAIYYKHEDERIKKKYKVSTDLSPVEVTSAEQTMFVPDKGEQLSFI